MTTTTEIDTEPLEVEVAVQRAREALLWWAELTFAERAHRLDRWRGVIARRAPELAQLIHREMGKPQPDAMLEIALALEHLAWAAKNAEKILGRRKVGSSLLTINQVASVEYRPLGVVGVIGPWNYPIFTPLGSLSFALAAGNAVVYKPSEFAPGVREWLGRAFNEVVPEYPVLQVVAGEGAAGAALCRAGVDKIGFTGSTATGKKVMAARAESLTPVLMECGGKDALILDADGDVNAAADTAVWGALSNAGQTCLGVERVYVQPTILVDVPEDSLAVTEETFGPTMTVTKVGSMDEAIELTNRSRYSLGLSIFSKNGTAIADRVRSGGASVNSFIMYAAIPDLPLGGVGDSGFGRVHGPDGLKEFTYARALTRQRFPSLLPLTTFRRSSRIDTLVRVLIRALHGRH